MGMGIGYWLWVYNDLLIIWIGLSLAFQGLGLGQVLCGFECLVFRILGLSLWLWS
jgi:hypothetical protein